MTSAEKQKKYRSRIVKIKKQALIIKKLRNEVKTLKKEKDLHVK